jgi:glycosyltransferase involved in cell wall biosynthesis
MKSLKVALVTDALYPWHIGGKEVRYQQLLTYLPGHDMDVTVYSMKWWVEPPVTEQFEVGSLTYCAICPRIPLYRGSRRSIVQAIAFAMSTFRLLTKQFDVIEADHMPYLQLVPLRIVAWIKRVPLVITWNEVWGKEVWRKYIGPAGEVAALIERMSTKLPSTIVAISQGTADKLLAMGASRERVRVVPMALDLDHLSQVAPAVDVPDLLFVGRLIDHKHADLAIEATKILLDRGLRVRLGIVGTGPEESNLRAQTAELQLDDQVIFYLNIESQFDLWALIKGTSVLLSPSVREGFGKVVAEALALGTPVVAVEHPENESRRLLSSDTGSVVAPFNPLALADAAESWLHDGSSRDVRISKFLSANMHLTVEAMTASYAEILRQVR